MILLWYLGMLSVILELRFLGTHEILSSYHVNTLARVTYTFPSASFVTLRQIVGR